MNSCAVSHCDRPANSKKVGALCQAHYLFKYRGGDPEEHHTRVAQVKICLVPDCEFQAMKHSLCTSHFNSVEAGTLAAPKGSDAKRRPDCVVDGCTNPSQALRSGECSTHYYHSRQKASKTADG